MNKASFSPAAAFTTPEDLEGMLQSGMEGDAVETWDRLEEQLETVKT